MEGFTEEFENKEVTITRKEFGQAVAEETHEIVQMARLVNPKMAEALSELLVYFGAGLMYNVFGDEEEDKLEVEE